MITTVVIDIVNRWVTEGLFGNHSLYTEDASEIQNISTFIVNNYKHLNPIILADNIQLVLIKHTGELLEYETCELIAIDIILHIKGGF